MELQFPSFVPEGARDLVSKLLRYNPSDRLPLQRVMEHSWVRANARRVLPPECPTQKSWVHLIFLASACLSWMCTNFFLHCTVNSYYLCLGFCLVVFFDCHFFPEPLGCFFSDGVDTKCSCLSAFVYVSPPTYIVIENFCFISNKSVYIYILCTTLRIEFLNHSSGPSLMGDHIFTLEVLLTGTG